MEEVSMRKKKKKDHIRNKMPHFVLPVNDKKYETYFTMANLSSQEVEGIPVTQGIGKKNAGKTPL